MAETSSICVSESSATAQWTVACGAPPSASTRAPSASVGARLKKARSPGSMLRSAASRPGSSAASSRSPIRCGTSVPACRGASSCVHSKSRLTSSAPRGDCVPGLPACSSHLAMPLSMCGSPLGSVPLPSHEASGGASGGAATSEAGASGCWLASCSATCTATAVRSCSSSLSAAVRVSASFAAVASRVSASCARAASCCSTSFAAANSWCSWRVRSASASMAASLADAASNRPMASALPSPIL